MIVKMMYWLPFVTIFLCGISNCVADGIFNERKYNFSYADLESCKEYDTKLGYSYHDYFAIKNITNIEYPGDKLRLNLFVLAARDAHILLSPTDQQDKATPVYEIVIGAGSNTFAEIRRQRQTQPLRTIRVKNILSVINPLPLTIRITADGVIDVRITGQENSIINATDKDPLTINYISFSSWGNTEGKWFFDCDGDKDDRLDEVIVRERSATQIFRDALFDEYDIHIVPMNLTRIDWTFNLKYADFDSRKTQIVARGKFKAVWFDPKLVWNPSDFNGIDSVYLQAANEKMWTPQIRLLNGVSSDFKSLSLQYSALINSSGHIAAETKDVKFTVWCNGVSGNWPIELVHCPIIMMFDEYTGLEFSPESFDLHNNDEQFSYDEAQYRIITTKAYPNAKKRFFDTENDEWPRQYTQFIFAILMKRNGSFYTHLFVTPLIGATVLILLSLWTERYLRVTLNSIGLLIVTAMHILLADYGPHGYVPSLVIYYNCLLVAAWVTLCLFIMNCCIKEFAGKVELLSGVLKLPWLRLMLGMDVSSSYEYKELQDEPSPNDDLRKLIDRIAFLLLVFIFGIFVALGY